MKLWQLTEKIEYPYMITSDGYGRVFTVYDREDEEDLCDAFLKAEVVNIYSKLYRDDSACVAVEIAYDD